MTRPSLLSCSRRSFALASLGLAGSMALALAGCSSNDGADNGEKDANTTSEQQSVDSSSEELEPQSTTLFVFDTVVSLSAQCSEELMDQLVERCYYFENKFSRTVEGSDIWNINHAAGAPVEVCAETAEVIQDAIGYAEATDGLFDISIGAVSSLWDFDEGIKPDDDAIQAALPHVGYQTINVDGTTVTLSDPDAMLDLGGIAKGYITDDLVRMLREGGCANASLSLGGNVYVMGMSYDGDEWNVGVQDPNGATDEVIATLQAKDVSVVTSGLYERGFEQDGVFYYHILDPKTGYPAKTDLTSASIVSVSSTDCDAYSTTLFLLGHDAAMELLDSDDRFQGILVDNAENATMSDGADFVLV